VIAGNLDAAEAALEHPAGDSGQYVWDEFPHALEYLVYAHLQRGDDRAAAAAIERLRSTKSLHPTFKTAFHLASIPARYALERQAWEEAAMLPVRSGDGLDWDRFPWPEAVTWFARALGSANLGSANLGAADRGRLDDARGAHQRLQELEGVAERMGEELFSRQIRVLRLAAGAWIAQAEGASESALEQMEAAAELEATTPKHPVTPAPTLPASEMLGFLLLRQQDPGRALAAFERALEQYPGRFNALLGAARAAQALGREQEARRTCEELVELAVEGSPRPGLKEAREILRR
jgi:tetratricopeptide (TPR) repeat protein